MPRGTAQGITANEREDDVATRTLAGTAVTIMHAEADLILQHGWNGAEPRSTRRTVGKFGLNLTQSALWAVAGRTCTQDDLTPLEQARYLDYLDLLEHALGMPVDQYQQEHADAKTMDIVWFLEETAWNLECVLLEALSE